MQASALAPVIERRSYRVAGLRIDLHFAGPALLPAFTPALAHLACDTHADPDLTVRLWDCASSGCAMPPCPTPVENFSPRGDLGGFAGRRYGAAYAGLGRILTLYDAQDRSALVCTFDYRMIPSYERASPLRALLGWLMRDHGRQLVHAACVGTSEGGVLIAGRGGAGKSNTAVGCLSAGFDYVGDDFCAVSLDGTPAGHSLYASAKVRSTDWACLTLPRANPEDPPSEKNVYFLHPAFRDRLQAEIPLLAILLPTRTSDEAPVLERVPFRGPLIELTSQAVALLPGAGPEVLAAMSRIVRQLPCYRFGLGARPNLIPAAISDLIAGLARPESHGDAA